jgi:hypothetical protein
VPTEQLREVIPFKSLPADHPIPTTPDEILHLAYQAADAGASNEEFLEIYLRYEYLLNSQLREQLSAYRTNHSKDEVFCVFMDNLVSNTPLDSLPEEEPCHAPAKSG